MRNSYSIATVYLIVLTTITACNTTDPNLEVTSTQSLPTTTGELFATNQVSPDTERCYKYQLRNFADWMADSHNIHDMEAVSTADLLAYRQSIQHLAA